MKKELELKLVEKYPKLFKQYMGDPSKTCMAFGLECSKGWYDIIDKLCEQLQKYKEVEIAQLKEKFGGLTIYLDNVPQENRKEVYDLISDTERKSYSICEYCGNPATLRRGNWLKTICDACHEKKPM